jgi:hypothetical protein
MFFICSVNQNRRHPEETAAAPPAFRDALAELVQIGLTVARRQSARGVADAIGREAESERAVRLTAALTERLEALDREAGIGGRSAEEIIGIICRDLGRDPARMTVRSAFPRRHQLR